MGLGFCCESIELPLSTTATQTDPLLHSAFYVLHHVELTTPFPYFSVPWGETEGINQRLVQWLVVLASLIVLGNVDQIVEKPTIRWRL